MVEFPGDMVRILLDSVGHDVFPTTSQVPAWNSTILDPNVPHTVTVIKMNSKTRYTLLYSFLVTYPGSPEDTPSSDLPTIATTSAPSNTGATSTVVIVGTLVSAVCLGLLGALGFYLWRRRRKPDATLNPFRKVEGRTSLFQSVDALHGEFCYRIFITRPRFDSFFSSDGQDRNRRGQKEWKPEWGDIFGS